VNVWNRWRGSLDTEWGTLVDRWVTHWQEEAKKSLGKGRPKRKPG
jgi:hypothetical protein